MRKFAVLLLAVLALYPVGMFLPQVQAVSPVWPAKTDYYTNFDNYPTGTVSPFPWTFVAGSAPSIVSGATSLTLPRSTPYSYAFAFTNTTSPPIYPHLSANFNATTSTVNATVYVAESANFGATGFLNMTAVSSVRSQTASKAGSTFIGFDTYVKLSVALPATPGSTVQINFSVTNPTLGVGTAYFDDFQIIGAAPIVTNYNFELYNTSSSCGASPCWFDPSGYTGSRLTLSYHNNLPMNDSNSWTNAPPGGFTLAAVKYASFSTTGQLFTFTLGSVAGSTTYTRTLLVNGQSSVAMYIDNPGDVFSYTVQMISNAGIFGANSQIFISLGSRVITSGNLSGSGTFLCYLKEGTYSVRVVSGTFTTTQSVNFPPISETVFVSGYASITPVTPAGALSSINWGVGWTSNTAPTSIFFTYLDNTSTTSQVGLEVVRVNQSGSFVLFSTYEAVAGAGSGPQYANFTFTSGVDFPANTLNYTMSSGLYGKLNTTNFLGTHYSLGSQQIGCNGCLFPDSFTFPNSIGGISTQVFGGISMIGLLAFGMIVLFAGAFGQYFNRFAFLVAIIMVGFASFAGWIAFGLLASGGVLATFLLVALLGLMTRHENTGG